MKNAAETSVNAIIHSVCAAKARARRDTSYCIEGFHNSPPRQRKRSIESTVTIIENFLRLRDRCRGYRGYRGIGLITFERLVAAEVPEALVALTVNVYRVPFVNPVAIVDVALAASAVDVAEPKLLVVFR